MEAMFQATSSSEWVASMSAGNQASARITFAHDRALGVIKVAGHGLWFPAYVDAHFAALERLATRVREEHGEVRALVDLRRSLAQPPETADRISHWTQRIYQAGDRVAIILANSMLKAQMRRVAMRADRELFISPTAAQQWLTA
jgi:non-ribosomal peptide synthetase component F